MVNDELFSLTREINEKLKKFQENSSEATALPFLWWYLNEGNQPHFFYEYAGQIIKIFTNGDYLAIIEGLNDGSRVGIYEIEPPPKKQLDRPTLQACLLYLSSLSSALREYGK